MYDHSVSSASALMSSSELLLTAVALVLLFFEGDVSSLPSADSCLTRFLAHLGDPLGFGAALLGEGEPEAFLPLPALMSSSTVPWSSC